MNRREFLKTSPAAAVALVAMSTSRPASAQFVVIDPAVLVQSIITAVQSVAAVVNQGIQIANQVSGLVNQAMSLYNEGKNLLAMPYSIFSQFNNQFRQFGTVLSTIRGLVNNVATLES